MKYFNYVKLDPHSSQSQWPRCLSRWYAAARLLRSWVRIPPRALMFVCCEWCVLSGRGLCYKLITSPKESYQLWCVVVCDLETSFMRRLWPTGGGGCCAKSKQTNKQVKDTRSKFFLEISEAVISSRNCPPFTQVKVSFLCRKKTRNLALWARLIQSTTSNYINFLKICLYIRSLTHTRRYPHETRWLHISQRIWSPW
jgi:hypothetical protein